MLIVLGLINHPELGESSDNMEDELKFFSRLSTQSYLLCRLNVLLCTFLLLTVNFLTLNSCNLYSSDFIIPHINCMDNLEGESYVIFIDMKKRKKTFHYLTA